MPYRVDSAVPLRELPGEAVPYSLADGDGRAHLLLGQVGRALAGAEETANAMSVMTALGPADRPIPMHYHEKEHDYFFCVRGRIQVWADGESRILAPGDVASVPAGVAARLPVPLPLQPVHGPDRAGRLGPLLRLHRHAVPRSRLSAG